MSNLLIQNGRVLDPGNAIDSVCDVYIVDGKIAALGNKPKDFRAEQKIDAAGWVVLPGLIDLCANLGLGGLGSVSAFRIAQKTTIASETHAAAAGGFTRVVCPPDTQPILDTPAMVRLVQVRAAEAGYVRVHPLGALTAGLAGERLSDMALLSDAGCVGVSNALQAVEDTLLMRRAMQYAATFDLPVFSTPRDGWLYGNGVVNEGVVSTRLGLPAIPQAAETVGLARDLALTETSGARVHFDLLSTGRAVEMIDWARNRRLPISASVSIHHLHCNDQDIGAFDTHYKVIPPLRSADDQRALVKGVRDGIIGAICSDHQPHDADAKLAPFVDAATGISSLDTLLPLLWDLVQKEELPLDTAIKAVTTNPAAVIGVDAGRLSPGARADLCLFDPELTWEVNRDTMVSRGENTPWLGCQLRGKVVGTLLDGEAVYGHENARARGLRIREKPAQPATQAEEIALAEVAATEAAHREHNEA